MTKSQRFMKKKNKKNRQEKAQYELQLKRIKNIMMNFKKPYNILSEFKGQAGEIMLFGEVHTAFPQDELIQKTSGVE